MTIRFKTVPYATGWVSQPFHLRYTACTLPILRATEEKVSSLKPGKSGTGTWAPSFWHFRLLRRIRICVSVMLTCDNISLTSHHSEELHSESVRDRARKLWGQWGKTSGWSFWIYTHKRNGINPQKLNTITHWRTEITANNSNFFLRSLIPFLKYFQQPNSIASGRNPVTTAVRKLAAVKSPEAIKGWVRKNGIGMMRQAIERKGTIRGSLINAFRFRMKSIIPAHNINKSPRPPTIKLVHKETR